MASETVSTNINWNALTSAKVFNETVTIDSGATLTLDETADAQGLADAAVGVNITVITGFSKFKIANASSSVAIQFAGPEAGTMRLEAGSKFEVRGGFIVLKDGANPWESTGAADQALPASAWTNLYAAANEPSVIFVETGDGTGVWEPWMNVSNLTGGLDSVGAAALGKFFSFNTATGAITFGDGGATAANRGGKIPVTGATVRVYNIGIGKVASGGAWGIHATLGTNYQTDTDPGGILDLQNCYTFGFFLDLQSATSSVFDHVGSILRVSSQYCKIIDWSFFFCGNSRYSSDYSSYMRSNGSVNIEDSIFFQEEFADTALFEYCANGRVYRTTFILGDRNSANDNALRVYRSPGFRTYDCKIIGGRFHINESPNVWMITPQHSDSPRGVAFGSLYSTSFGWDAASSSGGVLDGLTMHSEGAAAVFASGSLIGSCDRVVNCNYASLSQFVYTAGFGGFWHNNNFGAPSSRFSNHTGGEAGMLIQNSHLSTIVPFFNNSIAPSNSIFKGVDNNTIITTIPGAGGTHFYEFRKAITPESGSMGVFFTPGVPGTTAFTTVGTVSFDLNGRIFLLTSDAEIVYTWPHRVKGITAFPTAGTLTKGGTNPNNFTIEYQIDLGAGYSSWKTLSMANLDDEVIDPALGFLFKVKITRGSSAITDSLNQLTWDTTTNYATYKYPAALVSVIINGVVSGSSYRVFRGTTEADGKNAAKLIGSGTAGSSTITINDVEYTAEETITVRLRKSSTGVNPDYVPYTQQGTLKDSGATLVAQQVIDLVST